MTVTKLLHERGHNVGKMREQWHDLSVITNSTYVANSRQLTGEVHSEVNQDLHLFAVLVSGMMLTQC